MASACGPISVSIEVFRELSTSFEKELGCCSLAQSCSSVALNYRGASHKLMVGLRKINWGPTAYFINISPGLA